MRPILLQMAGLQSYRELQEIDFTQLCDAGVFGIFGPTGSGKSTILDAMTLALFGKVERAANGTQGIMNHAEQSLSVSFTFELGHAGGALRYRVDRQFKRGGDVAVHNTVSRLIRYQDEETVVLADKSGDVNQQVQDILGLSMQDFTRAVVLPQGKFAEFLALKGSERRQMLQRLFHLEPYGDQLNAKASGRFKEADVAVKELHAEQQGLGDASQQALDAAAGELRAAAEAARQRRAQLAACEARAAELRRVRELQQALALTRRQLAEHATRAPQVLALQERLARAGQAERAQPYARQRGLAAARLERERDAASRADQARQLTQAALERAGEAHAAAREALAAQETPLLLRLDKLQQARELAAELAKLRAALSGLAAQESQTAAALQAARGQQLREQELRDKALKRQAELKEELQQAEVRSEDRERLREALQEKRAIEQRMRQLEEQQAELVQHRQELDGLQRQLDAAGQQEAQWGRRLGQWLADAAESFAASLQQDDRLQRIAEEAARLQKESAKLNRQAELHAMAAELAEQLAEGESCPVCGSERHPRPFAPEQSEADVALAADAAAALELEQLLLRTKERMLDNNRLQVMLNGIIQQWQPMLPRLQANELLAEAAAALHAWGQMCDEARLKPAGAEYSESLNIEELQTEEETSALVLRQTKRQEQRLQQELQALVQERGQLDLLMGDPKAKQQSLNHLIHTTEQKAGQLALSVQELTRAWNSRFATSFAYETVESAMEQQRLQEQRAEDLRQRLDKSISFIEDKQTALAGLQEQANSLDRTLVQLQTELKHTQRQEAEKAERVREWAGEQPVEEQIAEAHAQLEQVRSATEQAKQSFEQAQQAAQQAAQTYAAAAQAAETAAEQAAAAEAEWRQQADMLGFMDPLDVQAALITEEQKRLWTAETEAHGKLEHQLQSQERQWIEQLDGRSVSEEVWQAAEAELTESKRQDEDALQAKAKAERDWESLQAKHERWLELEMRRAAKQGELTLLGKLQSVLRGNAFVEFLAEEQLMQVSRSASERLGQLTRQRYAIEVDSAGGFIIRDDANGGVKRPVSTLSGGETFLTSLSLALALSAQIQLKGQYPLEFFFLDEGFGTLDQELLETVIIALEKLHFDRLTVGVISHVPELRARLPRRLVVQPPEPGGRGSSVFLETL
ncbi:AAA family ATPase [Paenibacillus piri]|uniref:Nuclease SbcCD subunit C n=1 Tax=Paenibacillus piri TaxID=2547395 RepID=A0A4R5KMB1_9BACL|nr:SMC family ATPase [Paenibacillus piri]TDF96743.1 SMC family ATPase [Paenibacillus piri]